MGGFFGKVTAVWRDSIADWTQSCWVWCQTLFLVSEHNTSDLVAESSPGRIRLPDTQRLPALLYFLVSFKRVLSDFTFRSFSSPHLSSHTFFFLSQQKTTGSQASSRKNLMLHTPLSYFWSFCAWHLEMNPWKSQLLPAYCRYRVAQTYQCVAVSQCDILHVWESFQTFHPHHHPWEKIFRGQRT